MLERQYSMLEVFLGQLDALFGPGGSNSNDPWMYVIWFAPIVILMLYGQKFQSYMILGDISKSLTRLKNMKEDARKQAIEYVKSSVNSSGDPTPRIDKFLEYFTIMPVDMDPNGIIGKVEHVIRIKDERMRTELRRVAIGASDSEISKLENILEAATALNLIYKVVRHFYLTGKKTTSMFVLVQLQMIMPLLLQEAEALQNAIGAFKKGQPIGDGIGPMVVGNMMLPLEKMLIARETVYSETEYMKRKLFLLKAEGPGGTVGRPGEAVFRLINDLGNKVDAIIMIDAALKLEGEKTGAVAEGIGAAIGGIGVEKYQIEEMATKFDIPVYAVIVKQSIRDAISVMRKEVSESFEIVTNVVYSTIEDKTLEGQSVLVIGVGNTLGVSQ